MLFWFSSFLLISLLRLFFSLLASLELMFSFVSFKEDSIVLEFSIDFEFSNIFWSSLVSVLLVFISFEFVVKVLVVIVFSFCFKLFSLLSVFLSFNLSFNLGISTYSLEVGLLVLSSIFFFSLINGAISEVWDIFWGFIFWI